MVLRWRGSRTAAPGGAVAVRTAARETSPIFDVFVSFSVAFSSVFFLFSVSVSLFSVLFLLSPLFRALFLFSLFSCLLRFGFSLLYTLTIPLLVSNFPLFSV